MGTHNVAQKLNTRIMAQCKATVALLFVAALALASAEDFSVESATPQTLSNGDIYSLEVKSEGQSFLFVVKDKLPSGGLTEGTEFFPVAYIKQVSNGFAVYSNECTPPNYTNSECKVDTFVVPTTPSTPTGAGASADAKAAATANTFGQSQSFATADAGASASGPNAKTS